MLLANVSTAKFVLDAQRLAIKTVHALRISSVLIVEKNMHLIITKCRFYIREYDIQHIIEYRRIFIFLKLETSINRLMDRG